MDKTILFLAFLQKDKAGGRKNGQKNDNLAKRLKTEACAFLTKIGVAIAIQSHSKIISKIQLIGNKEVILFVKLNR